MKFHPAGHQIIRNSIIGIIVINFLSGLFIPVLFFNSIIAVASCILLILILQFFRYPSRHIIEKPEGILSPADGTVCVIEKCREDHYLHAEVLKVSVFMSPLNIHINWAPVKGRVCWLKHQPGKFYAAFKDKSAEENERYYTAFQLDDGREILTVQVAGAMARRILNFLHMDQQVGQQTEMGFIRFGSRVDLYLPADTHLSVKVGDRVTGSQTIIGYFTNPGL